MEKVVRKYKLGEEPNDLDYWLTKTPQERLAALEVIRDRYIRLKYGARQKFQMVYRVTTLLNMNNEEPPFKQSTGRDKDNLDLKNLPEE